MYLPALVLEGKLYYNEVEGGKMEYIQSIVDTCIELLASGGVLAGFFLVFIECFIPALPLSVFVAFNVTTFGFLIGFLISWMATCLGSFCCYKIFYLLENKMSEKFLNRRVIKKIKNTIDTFEKIRFTELVLLLTLPFTPSCFINILSGLTKMKQEKFLSAILIGKCFSIIFWGVIGKSLLESLTDLYSILYIVITLVLAYIISKIVSHRLHIE